MNFHSLSFQNFMSYRRPVTIPLSGLGLVVVSGENRVSSAADSNGSGKTALFDALSFVLFGQTLRGKRADDVACRFTTEPCEIKLEFSWQEARGVLVRTRRPATLTMSFTSQGQQGSFTDAQTVQDKITDMLGFGFRTFQNAVVFGQGAFERFAQADPAEQMRMVDEIQGLDLRQALDRAKRWRDEWLKKEVEAINTASEAEQQIVQLGLVLSRIQDARNAFLATKKERIKTAQEQVDSFTKRLSDLQEKLDLLRRNRVTVTQYRSRWTRLSELSEEFRERQYALEKIEVELVGCETTSKEGQDQINKLINEGRCPTCRRPVDSDGEVEKVRRAFSSSQQAIKNKVTFLTAQRREQQQSVSQKSAEIERHLKTLPAGFDLQRLVMLEAEVSPEAESRLVREYQELEKIVIESQNNLKKEKTAAWEGDTSIISTGNQIKTLRTQSSTAREQAAKAARTVKAAEYWIEAFGDRGIRSLVFDSTAGFLNTRIAHHLQVLTAGEAQVEVSTLTTLKSGATKERLSVATNWSWGAGTTHASSAGQERRIDLAIFAALQDVAEHRSARPFPLKVWDEPGDALDSRGKEIFCSWIEQEARSRGTGFLITHSPEIMDIISADHVWKVILDKSGSHLERQ